jgi:hypothetical protein
MYGCETPEELAHQRRGNATRQNDEALRQMGACHRAEHPYRGPRVVNGETLYELNDGSLHRHGGTPNPGWMWGVNGMPQRKEACF